MFPIICSPLIHTSILHSFRSITPNEVFKTYFWIHSILVLKPHSLSVLTSSLSGSQWIQIQFQVHSEWYWDTSWMGRQSVVGHHSYKYCTHSHLGRIYLANPPTGIFWGCRRKLESCWYRKLFNNQSISSRIWEFRSTQQYNTNLRRKCLMIPNNCCASYLYAYVLSTARY